MILRLLNRSKQVPVVLQMRATECGAACLTMVAQYFGKPVSLPEVRQMCSIGRDGVTAKVIAQTARTLGFEVKAYSAEPSAFSQVPLPAIVHWDFKHFIVVEYLTSKQVLIIDPAFGRRKLSLKEFYDGFTGVVMTFKPRETDSEEVGIGNKDLEFEEVTNRPSWFHYIQKLYHFPQIRHLFLQLLLASFLLQMGGLIPPVLIQVLIDRVLGVQLVDLVALLSMGFLAVIITQMVVNILRATLLVYFQRQLDIEVMAGFFEHILSLPYHFFQQQTRGDLLARLNSNTVIREIASNYTLSVIIDSFFVIIYFLVILSQSLTFSLFVLVIAIIQLVIIVFTIRPVHYMTQRHLIAQAEAQSYLVEALSGISTVKASGSEQLVINQWTNLFYRELDLAVRRNVFSAIVNIVTNTVRPFIPFALLLVGSILVFDQTMTVGTMLSLNAIAVSFLTPISSLMFTGQQMQLVIAHLDRIGDIMAAEPEKQVDVNIQQPKFAGQIELKNVSFRYTASTPFALNNVSLRIDAGQKVALIGATGSGKTTLAALVLGLYLPTEGDILYDNKSITTYNLQQLRSNFGVVLQEPFLFNTSIRANIAFHRPDSPFSEIMRAAKIASIHDEITQMPMGYETIVGEGGHSLSGGQRQRIAIARAIIHQPTILLFDEATSHLDTLTETLVDQNLRSFPHTRVIISHRLATVLQADIIVVLLNGQVVGQGTHQELLNTNPYYCELIHHQLSLDETNHSDALRKVDTKPSTG